MLGKAVFGSRTWICTIAAPALAASIAEAAICSGVTGTAGFFPTESADPVTAQDIITLRCMGTVSDVICPVEAAHYSAAPDRDTGWQRCVERATLHPIVRCAKP